MRISDWSSDVCSSDLARLLPKDEAALCPYDEHEDREPYDAQVDYEREDAGRVKIGRGYAYKIAEPLSAAKELAGYGTGHDPDRAELQAREEERHSGAALHIDQRVPAAGAQGLEH